MEGTDAHEVVLGLAPLPAGQQGLAVPVAIGGQAAALVYADGATDAEPVLAPAGPMPSKYSPVTQHAASKL